MGDGVGRLSDGMGAGGGSVLGGVVVDSEIGAMGELVNEHC